MLNLNSHSSILSFMGKDELVSVHVENHLLEGFQSAKRSPSMCGFERAIAYIRYLVVDSQLVSLT